MQRATRRRLSIIVRHDDTNMNGMAVYYLRAGEFIATDQWSVTR